ncbi:MAG: class I SAM-dependent methyltransferase, partial [Candidatus Diapherotrites archaeon]|nr:class I SAM-dependent methyltransferase [Candidatus Diapherotrites archaeon]
MKPIPSTKRLVSRLTTGKKTKSWPGGIKAAPQYRTAVGALKNRRSPKPTVSTKYTRRQVRTYTKTDQGQGPAIYSRTDVYETLHRMGDFQKGQPVTIADFACGTGLVGAKVAALAKQSGANPSVTFMDVTPKQEKIAGTAAKEAPGVPIEFLNSDVRRINAPANAFDRTYCRFAIKNLPIDQQVRALQEIFRTTKKGGVFVLNDMLSPSGLQAFQNAERRAKNNAGGNTGATHHVPTE